MKFLSEFIVLIGFVVLLVVISTGFRGAVHCATKNLYETREIVNKGT